MRYTAHLGWLQNNGYNNVTFLENAIEEMLVCLNGSKLYFSDKLRDVIGNVTVIDSIVYVEIPGAHIDLTRRPALAIGGVAVFKDGIAKVQSVQSASIFYTDSDNGNYFKRVLHETIYDLPYGVEGPP